MQVLNCKVFVGYGSCKMDSFEGTMPYWLVNGMFVEDYPQYFAIENG